jgi:hypothetical protein
MVCIFLGCGRDLFGKLDRGTGAYETVSLEPWKAESAMILFVHPDKMAIKDFIMWSDVEFCMQLEILERRNFKTQEVAILDLGEIEGLAGAAAGETLYVLCHGGLGSPSTSLDGYRIHWTELGTMVGSHLGESCKKIVLFACYAGDGDIGKRGIDLFIKGLAGKRKGVAVVAYKGSTVTTTFNAIGARDAGATGVDPISTLNESTQWYPKQVDMISIFAPQEQFKSFLGSRTGASVRDRAIAAASISEPFYYAYGTTMQREGNYFPAMSPQSVPITLTS